MGLSSKTLLSKTYSLACNCRKFLENWAFAPKSITKGLPQPKLWVVSKIFCGHFFSLDLAEKKLGRAFFHQNNILGFISRLRVSGPERFQFWPFFKKSRFLQKQPILVIKILDTNYNKNKKNVSSIFKLKCVVFTKKGIFWSKWPKLTFPKSRWSEMTNNS